MKTVSIDLGSGGPECCTDSPLKSEPSKYYPTVHYNGDKPLNLPDEGEITVTFRKVSESTSKNSDGKKSYSCTLEIREITEIEAEENEVEAPAKNLSSEAGDSLDRLRNERIKEMKDKY